jgi:predicted enzyme related to lactoylglutathione lyase
MLMAQDMNRALAFYRDVFGLAVKESSPWWSELACGDAIVALHHGGDGSRHPTGLSLQVDDIEEAARRAQAAGATLVHGPEARAGEGIKLADLIDPEGNTFMMSQQIRG